MNIRQLHTFRIVCETESLTQAARVLNTTQPAISRSISELEEQLGTHLFDRISRKLAINENGRLFLSKVVPLLELYDDLEHSFSTQDSLSAIRLGAAPSIASYLLPDLLKRFRLSNEQTTVKVTVANESALEQMLLHHQLDLALIEGVVENDQLTMVPFSSAPLSVVCAPDHHFASLGTITVPELMEEPLLLHESGSAVRQIIDSALRFHGQSASPSWTSHDTLALLQAVRQDMGIAILPSMAVEEDLYTGRLTELQVIDFNLGCSYQIAFHKEKYQTLAFQNLVNLILFS